MKFEGFLVKIAGRYLSWRNKHEISGKMVDVAFVSIIAAVVATLIATS